MPDLHSWLQAVRERLAEATPQGGFCRKHKYLGETCLFCAERCFPDFARAVQVIEVAQKVVSEGERLIRHWTVGDESAFADALAAWRRVTEEN